VITIQRDIGDLLDRFAIAKLKSERIGTEENKREFKAFEKAFNEEVKGNYPQFDWEQFFEIMLKIHEFIWMFEAGSKSGKEELPNKHYILAEENKEVLAKLGLINIEIKNYNSLRIAFKNLINKLTGTGFVDIKKNHLSE